MQQPEAGTNFQPTPVAMDEEAFEIESGHKIGPPRGENAGPARGQGHGEINAFKSGPHAISRSLEPRHAVGPGSVKPAGKRHHGFDVLAAPEWKVRSLGHWHELHRAFGRRRQLESLVHPTVQREGHHEGDEQSGENAHGSKVPERPGRASRVLV